VTDPIASRYQGSADPQSVYQPEISSSDGDYSDEKKAVGTYQKTYGSQGSAQWGPQGGSPWGPQGGSGIFTDGSGAIPNLAMAYTTSPDLLPLPGNGASGAGGSSAPEPRFPVNIELGTLMATENSFLGATNILVNDYRNELLPVVQNAINDPTIWGTTVTTGSPPPPSKAAEAYGSGYQSDPLNKEGQKFGQKLNPAMGKLLNSIGSVIEAMGVFTSMINTVGQYYTQADFSSRFPAPGLMEGPNPPSAP
jgi:hypothetical protein